MCEVDSADWAKHKCEGWGMREVRLSFWFLVLGILKVGKFVVGKFSIRFSPVHFLVFEVWAVVCETLVFLVLANEPTGEDVREK
jgi:hypothetical protein